MRKEEKVNYAALWIWARFSLRRIIFLLRISWRHWHANRRRRRKQRRLDGSIPSVLAISPTMHCNYNCQGCYSRGRPTDNELSTDELNTLFSEAEELGIHSIVLTGGEPLLRDDILDLISQHRRILFFFITNGSLVTHESARRIARSGNIVLLVSIEGFSNDTDERRQPGTHEIAMHAFASLRKARAVFGFVATNTSANTLNSLPMSSSIKWSPLAVQLASSLNTYLVARTRSPTGSWTKLRESPSTSAFSSSGAANRSSSVNSPTMSMV